jgi:hypothetical protein
MRISKLCEEYAILPALRWLGGEVVDGMVKIIELLINIVTGDELKVLTSSYQNGE